MNCKQTLTLLDDYLDGALESDERHAVAGHLGDCPDCHRALEAEQRLRSALRDLDAPEPDDEFFERALETAAGRARARRSRRRGLAVGGALAAGFVLVLTTQLLRPALDGIGQGPAMPTENRVAQTDDVPGISIALGEVHKVGLAIQAAMNIDQATFVIALPPGVELSGFPGQRIVRWQGRLKQGKNLLELPIVVNEGHGGILEARIEHDGKRSVYRVKMKTEDPARVAI